MKTIGGFFELEIPYRRSSWHSLALPVNSARNGFEYILRSRKPAKVYLPNYICNSMLQPLNVCDVAYEFYNINNQLEINKKPDVSENELLLYVNYYGIKRDYCKKLYKEYGNHLVIDSTQAFFEKPLENVDTIYSTRKFFGVSDGGYLYTKSKEIEIKDQDISVERVRHLVGRLESSASDYYVDYRRSKASLANQPIKKMSKLTNQLMQSLDYENIKLTRERNFLYLHNTLKETNSLMVDLENIYGPMVYPYLYNDVNLRQALIAENIFVAKYWQEVLGREVVSTLEKELVENLLPLPIDQRYNLNDMQRVLFVINNHRN